MTANKNTLTQLFQNGDVPQGADYANFIDSCVNVAETSAQTINSPIIPTELITARVSAGNVNVTGTLTVTGQTSVQNFYVGGNIFVSGAFSANTINTIGLVAASASFTNANITTASATTVYADKVIQPSGIVSAAGTTQGAAAVLTNVINRGKGVADGSTTGFTPLANNAGLVQYLLNEGPSANLWPPTGGFINGLAVNTPFALAASAAFTIFHITASSYGVK